MSAPISDGGPAFPVGDMQTAHRVGMAATSGTGHPESEYIAAAARATAGMTLRDYFAARIAQSLILAPEGSIGMLGESRMEATVRVAFAYADAMLAAREVQS